MIDFAELLNAPLKLFCKLYEYIQNDFLEISNDIRNQVEAHKRYERLSVDLFNRLGRVYGSGDGVGKAEVLAIIEEQTGNNADYNLLCISLFKALAEYMGKGMVAQIRSMGAITVGNLTITLQPANPIYESLSRPIRKPESVGVSIKQMTDLFRDLFVIEQMKPRISLMKPDALLRKTNRYLENRIQKDLTIGVSPFGTDLEYKYGSLIDQWSEAKPTPYWFEKVGDPQEAKDFLLSLLNQCLQLGVNILVLPELTMDAVMLDALKAWLLKHNREQVSSGENGLVMVVAGSFHVQDDQGDFYNTSTVFNHAGDMLWAQKKHQPFSLDHNDVKKAPELKHLVGITDAGGYENIKSAETLYCVDTPLGRLCVSICLDFFHPDNLEAFRHSGVNVFFVPAMSPGNEQFQWTARAFGRSNLASSFVALTSFLPRKPEDANKKNVSFYYLPDKTKKYFYALGDQAELLTFTLKVNK